MIRRLDNQIARKIGYKKDKYWYTDPELRTKWFKDKPEKKVASMLLSVLDLENANIYEVEDN